MDKLVSIFRKIAWLLTIILLLVLAVLEFISLINALDGNPGFMGAVSSITIHLLLMLLFAAPAILLLVKKDKEAMITLGFLIGYLFITAVTRLIGYGVAIRDNVPAITVIYAVVSFTLGLAYGVVLIFFLLSKVFGLKLMKLSYLILIFGLALIVILIILEIIMAADQNWTFAMYVSEFATAIVIPAAMVFSLMLLEGDEK